MDSNVWGAGGLFEKALASKLNRQQSETDLNNSNVGVQMMNAQTNLLGVNNQYDLGLRRNDVERGLLDVNRGQLDVSRIGAQTNRYGAETDRMKAASPRGLDGMITAPTISNLGFTTVQAPGTAATPSATSTPSLRLGANSFGDKPFGMMNGGVALKPKMVKQPGYMHGGKVTMPKGYKKGGKIGDVKHDEGKDTMDVKARPGEYFLNPETVAYIGGGNYNEGVKFLDDSVRMATGKEPGPTPVGKSGKPGFVLGGEFVPDSELRPEFRGQGMYGATPEALNAAQQRAYMDRVAAQQAGKGPGFFSRAAQAASAALDAPVGETAKKVGEAGKAAAVKVGQFAGSVANHPVNKFIGKVATPVAALGTSYKSAYTPTDEYAARYSHIIDPSNSDNEFVRTAKDMGVRAMGTLSDFGNALTFGLADNLGQRVGNLASGKGFVSNPTNAPAPAAAAKSAPVNKEAVAMTPEEAARREALNNPPAKPTLRDMYMQRLADIDTERKNGDGLIGATRRMQMEEALLKELGDLEKAGVTNAKSAVAANEKFQQETDDRIDKHFTMTQVDDKGKTTKVADPDQARAFREHMGKLGKDIYQTPRAEQDKLAREFALRYRGNEGFNTIQSEAGGKVSDTMDAFEIDPNGVGFGAAATYKGISAMDGLRAWLPWTPDETNVLVRNRVTGEAAPASRQFARPGGGFDYEAFRQAQKDDNALRKMMADAAKKQQAK